MTKQKENWMLTLKYSKLSKLNSWNCLTFWLQLSAEPSNWACLYYQLPRHSVYLSICYFLHHKGSRLKVNFEMIIIFEQPCLVNPKRLSWSQKRNFNKCDSFWRIFIKQVALLSYLKNKIEIWITSWCFKIKRAWFGLKCDQ